LRIAAFGRDLAVTPTGTASVRGPSYERSDMRQL
jgi:hypothetical protein